MSMFDRFVKTLKDSCSVCGGDSVVVCCSGGMDSMVLVQLMTRAAPVLGLRLGVVHVDHGNRENASKEDARFVEEVCRDLMIPFHSYELHIDCKSPNLEEYARNRRYEAIMRCRYENGYDHAATGHTMDDQAETLIYRIIRGSGMRGLTGMDYTGPQGLIRPLLGFSRDEISSYAAANTVGFVHDATNDDTVLVRNFIRHRILPLMKEVNPGISAALSRLSNIARMESRALEEMAESLEERARLLDWNIVRAYRAGDLRNAHEAVVKRMIISILSDMLDEPRGVDALQVQGVFDVLKAKKRAHTVKRRIRAVLDGDALVFMDAGKGPFFDVRVDAPGVCRIERLQLAARLDFPKTEPLPLRIRSFIKGDRIKGKRVAKIMSEKGIMRSLRGFWPVLICRDEILSVPGILDAPGEGVIHTEFPCYD